MKPLALLLAVKSSIFRVIPLMRDARVPATLKASTIALGVVVISPLDLFGDIPLLGALDDAALLSLLCYAFVSLAARYTAVRVPALR